MSYLYEYIITDNYEPPALTYCPGNHVIIPKGTIVLGTQVLFPGKIAMFEGGQGGNCHWWDITGHATLYHRPLPMKQIQIMGLGAQDDTIFSLIPKILLIAGGAYILYNALTSSETKTANANETVLSGLKRHRKRLLVETQELR